MDPYGLGVVPLATAQSGSDSGAVLRVRLVLEYRYGTVCRILVQKARKSILNHDAMCMQLPVWNFRSFHTHTHSHAHMYV